VAQSLKEKQRELQIRLERAYKIEDDNVKLKTNPILYTKEFMALSNEETCMFMDKFMELDKDRWVP
jgi:hypothetical protein